jgi:glutamate dehydrogenase
MNKDYRDTTSVVDEARLAVAERARANLPPEQLPQIEAFLHEYYRQLDADDLAERSPADLYGAALSHWQFLRRFAHGAPKVRVYNPSLAEHGWQSSHTVVEIVNDDMPFLVDTVTMEVNRQGLTLHLIVHPVMKAVRDEKGVLLDLAPSDAALPNARLESYIHVEVDRQADAAKLQAIQDGLVRVLGDVRLAVADWKAMVGAMREVIERLGNPAQVAKLPVGTDEAAEEVAFLRWISDNHFTFLGYREYDLTDNNGTPGLKPVPQSGLGILRNPTEDANAFTPLPPQAQGFIDGPNLLLFTKANVRATVHRPGYLDYIGIKRFDANGKVNGELRFLGLLTSVAYSASPATIPLLRRKAANVAQRAGFLPGSHMDKSLLTLLEHYPREELFQIDENDLYDVALGILRLEERQRTRLFVRRDLFGRYMSCLVFVPRDKYNTELRLRIQRILMQAFNGVAAEFSPDLSEAVLARIHFTIRTQPGQVPDFDVRELENRIIAASRRWQDDLQGALTEQLGEDRGLALFRRYGEGIPAGYREETPARSAVYDIEMIDGLEGRGGIAMNLYRPIEAGPGQLRFKLYRAGRPITLSESLPMLEHMGVQVLEERPWRAQAADGSEVWIHDFGLQIADMDPDAAELAIEQIKPLFQDAFARAVRREIENDDFNRLVLKAQLDWRQVTILRAYAKYLRQIGFNFSQAYIEATLARNAGLAHKLVELFLTRFDPAMDKRKDKLIALLQGIDHGLDQVANLDEDRILRQYLAVIQATLRTNYFQRDKDGKSKGYLSFKLNPAQVPGLPEPKPMFEIWVYAPWMEGIHLRGGKVARGGLRWSDRREDFRTEILGLVKAQMVKNTVIVPVGSKGGFVVKNPPPAGDREAFLNEGIRCYRTLLSGMLDITDNLVQGQVVPPKDVERYDPDDPYLVVAADKGTATFSDIANGVSADYCFWLGDAFASGGSVGYDHKEMGITARGAWESVKRHFRELGVNTQTTDFTVVGIGDMSGDVFGNGMLLSRHIKLLAAFDHRDIFLDPNPDPETSFVERERMFKLPRSSWVDYDKSKISAGGGVFSRSLKTIPLSAEVRQALGVEAERMTPQELMRAILLAPVDLLYNGGIGTYVKTATETHAQVGDRANDAIRVDGRELRCKVLGEGGNLGLTQLGRIEFAQAGGRLYTDAIDNSAGVDCSDHEVNIKILLNRIVAAGDMTEKQRNKLLAEMTDEVGMLVLQDNYYQTQALSVTGRLAPQIIDYHARLIRALERRKLLNRKIEFLPSEDQIKERKLAGQGLTPPERAVLLAYAKMALFDDLLASDLPEDSFFAQALVDYFPHPLRERYYAEMQQHPLRREIIATYVTNGTVNRAGTSFVNRLGEETGATAAEVVRAYTAVREIFALPALWGAIEGLDNQVPDEVQARMTLDLDGLNGRATLWLLRRHGGQPIVETVKRYSQGVAELREVIESLLSPNEARALQVRREGLVRAGVPADTAARVASADVLFPALDIIDIARETGQDVRAVAAVYFALDAALDYGWLRGQIAGLAGEDHWSALARAALQDDLASQQRALTASVFKLDSGAQAPAARIDGWIARNRIAVDRARQVIADLHTSGTLDLAMLSVAMRELRGLG